MGSISININNVESWVEWLPSRWQIESLKITDEWLMEYIFSLVVANLQSLWCVSPLLLISLLDQRHRKHTEATPSWLGLRF